MWSANLHAGDNFYNRLCPPEEQNVRRLSLIHAGKRIGKKEKKKKS
jgi:hypothetical protein